MFDKCLKEIERVFRFQSHWNWNFSLVKFFLLQGWQTVDEPSAQQCQLKSTNSTDLRHFQALNLIIVVRQPIHVMCITDAISFPCSYVFLITELSLESDWALWSHTKKSSTFCSSWKYLNKHFPFCSPQEIPNIFSTFLF